MSEHQETAAQIVSRFQTDGATNEEYKIMESTEVEAPFGSHYGAPRVVKIYGHWFLSIEPDAGLPNMLPVSDAFAAAWTAEFIGREF